MKFFLLPVAFMAVGAVAQTTTACAADYIVETCLGTENSKLAACASTDYECLCAAHQSLITCFNNCPNDSRIKNAQGQRDIFCGYAKQYPSTTAKAPTAAQTSGSQPTAAGQTEGSTDSDSSAPSTTSSSSPATNTNSAAYLALNAGGVLAAIAGVVAVVL